MKQAQFICVSMYLKYILVVPKKGPPDKNLYFLTTKKSARNVGSTKLKHVFTYRKYMVVAWSNRVIP